MEAKIVASADSMSHFVELHRLFWLAYHRYDMDVEEGKKWVLDKLERSYKKLMPEAKVIIKDKYEAAKKLFEV